MDLRERGTEEKMEVRDNGKRSVQDTGMTTPTACLMRELFDTIADCIVFIDRDYRIRALNRAMCETHGVEPSSTTASLHCYEVLHCSSEPCFNGSSLCPLTEVLEKKTPVSTIHVHQDKTGHRHIVELNSSPIYGQEKEILGIVTVGRDITERLRVEEEQKQLEKRYYIEKKERTLATLAAGLAHDFNNSLTGVMGNAELLLRMLKCDSPESRFAESILELSQRMANLTGQLLAYAKGGKYKVTVKNPANVMVEVLANVEQRFSNAGVKTCLVKNDDLWHVQGDYRQLRQLFESLLTNGFEAMEGTGGRLNVRFANVRKEVNWVCAHQHTHGADEYVRITVEDSGVGIPKENVGKIFEPFFSTKFLGRGLGLAAALGIARNHGGCISVESQAGGGATVEVLLPRARPEHQEGRLLQIPPGANKVLVVDDEPQVIWIVTELLRAEGFDTITAETGQEALAKIQTEQDNIGLIILDVLMPGLSGTEIYSKIKEISPHIPVFFSSGYDKQTALAGIRLWKGDGFFRKPYRAQQLLALVRNHVTRP